MKKFKKFLGMALAFSLVITQFPAGKAAKAASGEAVKILPRASWGEEAVKGTLVDTTTATEAFNTATLTVESSSVTDFASWFEMHVIVTVNGEETDLKFNGTGNGTKGETATVELSNFTVNTGDQYKIEVYSDAWQDQYVDGVWTMAEDYTYKVSIGDFAFEAVCGDTPSSDAVKILPRASWSEEAVKGTLVDTTTATETFNTATLTVESSSETNFASWFEMYVIVTVNGEEKALKFNGTGNGTTGETATVKLSDFTVNEGDQYKIEVYSDAWQDKYVDGAWTLENDYTYKVSIGSFSYKKPSASPSEEPSTTPSDTPSGEPSTSPSDTPSGEPSTTPSDTPSGEPSTTPSDTPPSGDDETPKVGEVQTSSWTEPKKLATIIPETTADDNYNTAAVTVQCANDVSFNEWCNLNVVVTVNGKATTITQKGDSYDSGVTSTYDIKNEFAIKKGDKYKVEAYTDAWDKHTSSWVFKVSVVLGYEASDVNLEQGKLYYGKKADVLETSNVTADCDSLTFEVKCAADTSFNPWTSIDFIVIINSTARTITVKGTDETYAAGSTQSCTINGLGIKAGDCVPIQAMTSSWDSASDYVFKLTPKDTEGTFTPSSSEMEAVPVVEPSKVTSNPTTAPSAEPTTEPSTEPTDDPSQPTVAPGTEPTDDPSQPTVEPSTEPTKAPALQKGDEISKSGNTYEVASASAKTVTYVSAVNVKKVTVTVPATIKTTVNGKSVTCKVVSISDNAFKNNKNLKTITLGSNIKTIGKNAFSGCKKLNTITIKSTKITTIGKNAFKNVPKTAVVKVPKAKVKAYSKTLKKAGFKGKVKSM